MRDTSTEEAAGITAACNENRWLRGRETAVSLADDAAEAALFVSSSRLTGEGVVYGDIALVQQVALGDEWLALKRDGEAWFAFDSLSLSWASSDLPRFENLLISMNDATPDECRRLAYAPLRERPQVTAGIEAEPARPSRVEDPAR